MTGVETGLMLLFGWALGKGIGLLKAPEKPGKPSKTPSAPSKVPWPETVEPGMPGVTKLSPADMAEKEKAMRAAALAAELAKDPATKADAEHIRKVLKESGFTKEGGVPIAKGGGSWKPKNRPTPAEVSKARSLIRSPDWRIGPIAQEGNTQYRGAKHGPKKAVEVWEKRAA